MGYLVATTGRLLLPSELERQALTVAEHRMAARPGWFDPDAGHVDSLSDLAAYAGVSLTREGEWLSLATDHGGDPKWSEQAEEFYRSLSDFVHEGEVHLRGEDGSVWSYTYSGDGVEQHGDNGWGQASTDAAFEAPEQPTPSPPPVTEPPPAPSATQPDPRPEPEPEAEPPGGFSYPGKEDRPARATPPPTPPVPDWTPGEDEAPPASPGRALAMSALLVVGVLLIIGLAVVVAGI